MADYIYSFKFNKQNNSSKLNRKSKLNFRKTKCYLIIE